ncbi:MAG: hypothetical protein F6J93_15790 [Oscillatoria sp. SIO1A7]|nr:hypothetical protein [Oscillatoria sp. SIO1A7]
MVQYALPQSPEVILTVPGNRDSAKARNRAMDKLMELMEEGQLDAELKEGFSPEEFVEVKEPELEDNGEDAVTEAVQILSSLATLKIKVENAREQALEVRTKIDILFADEAVSEEEIANLKEGFKILKAFAQANQRYQAARAKAEEARAVLDRALQSRN